MLYFSKIGEKKGKTIFLGPRTLLYRPYYIVKTLKTQPTKSDDIMGEYCMLCVQLNIIIVYFNELRDDPTFSQKLQTNRFYIGIEFRNANQFNLVSLKPIRVFVIHSFSYYHYNVSCA